VQGADELLAASQAAGKRAKGNRPLKRFLAMVRCIASEEGAAADKTGRLLLDTLNKHHLQRLGIRESAAEAIIAARSTSTTMRELEEKLGDALSLTDRIALRFCVRFDRRTNEDTDASTDDEPDAKPLRTDEPLELRKELAANYTMAGLREIAAANEIALEGTFIGKQALANHIAREILRSHKDVRGLTNPKPALLTDRGVRVLKQA
jgi:hypothetical protein